MHLAALYCPMLYHRNSLSLTKNYRFYHMKFNGYHHAYNEFQILQHMNNQHVNPFFPLQYQEIKEVVSTNSSSVVYLCLQSNTYTHNWQNFNTKFTLHCLSTCSKLGQHYILGCCPCNFHIMHFHKEST